MVLERIVEVARELLGARYAAIGVIGPDGLLEQFIHLGMDAETVAAIGDPPKGKGVLGALIEDSRPIRLARIADDERSWGFPAGHPLMEGFLGVPIRFRDAVFGILYLTDCVDGEFTVADEELVLGLAATAAVAIENAQLYEESRRRQLWLQGSARISSALLSPATRNPLWLIAERVKRLADADTAALTLRTDDPQLLRIAVAIGDDAAVLQGARIPVAGSVAAAAMDTGRGVRVDSIDDQHHFVHLALAASAGAALAVPMSGNTGPQGAIVLLRRRGRRRFSANEMEMAEMFANYAGIAQELVTARADQQKVALLEDRDRIARDLHDHVVQGLFAAGLTIQSVAARSDPGLAQQLGRSVADINGTIRQIRTSIFQLTRTDTTDIGLRAAVLAVIQQLTPSSASNPPSDSPDPSTPSSRNLSTTKSKPSSANQSPTPPNTPTPPNSSSNSPPTTPPCPSPSPTTASASANPNASAASATSTAEPPNSAEPSASPNANPPEPKYCGPSPQPDRVPSLLGPAATSGVEEEIHPRTADRSHRSVGIHLSRREYGGD